MSGDPTAEAAPAPPTGSRLHQILNVVARRWPTWLALVMAVVLFDGADEVQGVQGLSEALIVFAVGYLAAAVIGRPGITWPAALLFLGAVALTRLQEVVTPTAVLLALGVVLVVTAAVSGRLRERAVVVQVVGLVVFSGTALAVQAIDGRLALVVVGLGWLAHAGWDVAHLRWRTVVVSRSFGEWCAVFDGLRGGLMILAAVVL